MNIFDAGYPKILETVSKSLEFIIPDMQFYGIVGFFLGLLIVLVGIYFKWFRRISQFFKFFTYLYYIIIPFGLALCGAIIAGLNKADLYVEKEIPETATPLSKVSYQSYRYFLDQEMENLQESGIDFYESVRIFTDEINFDNAGKDRVKNQKEVYNKYMESPWSDRKIKSQYDLYTKYKLEELKLKIANNVVPKVTKWEIQSIVETACEYTEIDSGGKKYGLSKKTCGDKLLAAYKVNLFKYRMDFWDEVNKKSIKKCKKYFTHFYPEIIGLFVLIIVLPIIEMALYFLFFKKRGM